MVEVTHFRRGCGHWLTVKYTNEKTGRFNIYKSERPSGAYINVRWFVLGEVGFYRIERKDVPAEVLRISRNRS